MVTHYPHPEQIKHQLKKVGLLYRDLGSYRISVWINDDSTFRVTVEHERLGLRQRYTKLTLGEAVARYWRIILKEQGQPVKEMIAGGAVDDAGDLRVWYDPPAFHDYGDPEFVAVCTESGKLVAHSAGSLSPLEERLTADILNREFPRARHVKTPA